MNNYDTATPSSQGAQSSSTRAEALYAIMKQVVEKVQKALEEQQCTDDLMVRWPSLLFCVAIYLHEIVEYEGDRFDGGAFMTMVKETKEKMRLEMGALVHGRENPIPGDWDPETEIDLAGEEAAEMRESYSYLTGMDQLQLARQAANLMFGACADFAEPFRDDPMPVISLLFEGILEVWGALLEDHLLHPNFTSLLPLYAHFTGFLQKPSFETLPSPIPAEFPRPIHANETRAPLSLLFALRAFHSAHKEVLEEQNFDRVVGSLSTAFLVLCAVTQADPLGINAIKTGKVAKAAIAKTNASFKKLENVEFPPGVLDWFKELCSVCKTTPAVRKMHYYLGWEEMDMAFRFGVHWKLLPRPKTLLEWKEPHQIVAALLASWARDSQPNSRWDMVIELLRLIFDLCQGAKDPERQLKTWVEQIVPHLSHLFPTRSHTTPQFTFLLAIPFMIPFAPTIAEPFLSAIASKIQDRTAKLPPASTQSPSEITASLPTSLRNAFLSPTNGAPTPSLAQSVALNTSAAANPNANPSGFSGAAPLPSPSLPSSSLSSSPSLALSKPMLSPYETPTTPARLFCNADDLLVWASLNKNATAGQKASRVDKAAWELALLFQDVPGCIKTFLTTVDEQIPIDNTDYLPLLRCLYSKIRAI